jgi:hypothetical protein
MGGQPSVVWRVCLELWRLVAAVICEAARRGPPWTLQSWGLAGRGVARVARAVGRAAKRRGAQLIKGWRACLPLA